MRIKVFGSKDCLTCLKAKKWLENHRLAYQFIDLEKTALSIQDAKELCSFKEVQATQLFATWSEAFLKMQVDLSNLQNSQLISLCREHTEVLRRPLIIIDDVLFIGYDEQLLEQLVIHE
ncbi:arsenate reductase [Enterococcus thailandicus]|uniref:Spx/MgsR family RNA polymerase-binding regulatory protein n=1 Tax=Enterococcus TaxID=1350 RepID=UPI001C4AC054|nr:Spx/MgsR family RNA polymerase-binding regulatory protein [Enterococcus thailandicus]MDK4353422.1 Spx/MgsR family RNA polymerase-binding regulatory protein [Enterococcus thailandicus]MDT2735396.1 Spx/MgsR family RNA polymerase-binding regulatory protein [Enterococcus thailandicus]MEA4829891.1 Spx/MgsR family RNA polymerase-binding regulatory protein [Enterococcus thailandicus]GMC03051.1 arsenate reductase [Enterococcus thailandicus]GMC10380.1 arsenate reductase [Enterococcus thailandicus]